MKIVIWLPVEMRVTVKEREEEKIHLVLPCLLEPTDVLVRAGRTDESGEVVASAFGSRRRLLISARICAWWVQQPAHVISQNESGGSRT
jgi:hypothetical protein